MKGLRCSLRAFSLFLLDYGAAVDIKHGFEYFLIWVFFLFNLGENQQKRVAKPLTHIDEELK